MASSRVALVAVCLAALAALASAGVGVGAKCDMTGNPSFKCNDPLTCAMWVEGGKCCRAPFIIKEGDYCNVGSSVCCSDAFECKANKCVKKGPPPCSSFKPIGDVCDPAKGVCCGGNKVPCTNGRCISPYPTTPSPPPCSSFKPIGDVCDPAKGICCGGNRIPCTNGRCISSAPTSGRKLQ